MITEIAPYLNFAGQASDAIELYKKALGAELVEHMTWGDMPGEGVPPEMAKGIMHACLKVGTQQLFLSDLPPQMELQRGTGASVLLQFDDPAKLDAVFAVLAEGGEITMPLEDTFWNARFGGLKDRFGVSWMLNCQK